MRIHAIDVATIKRADLQKVDIERFINTGVPAMAVQSPQILPARVRYEIERIKRNDGHYVAPEDQVRFDAERN